MEAFTTLILSGTVVEWREGGREGGRGEEEREEARKGEGGRGIGWREKAGREKGEGGEGDESIQIIHVPKFSRTSFSGLEVNLFSK